MAKSELEQIIIGKENLARPITTFVDTLQGYPGGPQGYRLRRIILTNFWLYGQQEFEIPHGRLFLAGENASGKSTVLTAALPLGLDGDLHPNRLDTFGRRERRIEYYVLGSADSATPFNHERRTAYIPLAVTILAGSPAEERTNWLQRLESLHQQREAQDSQIQQARNLETIRFQELGEARRHFQSVQDRAYQSQNVLDDILKPFLTTNELMLYKPDLEAASDEPSTGSIVEQFAAAIDHYHQLIDTLESNLVEAIDFIQGELNDLHLYTGGKRQEIADLQSLYEKKQAEPEVTPMRSDRRIAARAKLAEHGIDALPLYALLDFAPDLDEASAGQIEYMLEDAGLLDALIVPTAQITEADAVLTSEGLSDCRLDIEMIGKLQSTSEASRSLTTANGSILMSGLRRLAVSANV